MILRIVGIFQWCMVHSCDPTVDIKPQITDNCIRCVSMYVLNMLWIRALQWYTVPSAQLWWTWNLQYTCTCAFLPLTCIQLHEMYISRTYILLRMGHCNGALQWCISHSCVAMCWHETSIVYQYVYSICHVSDYWWRHTAWVCACMYLWPQVTMFTWRNCIPP